MLDVGWTELLVIGALALIVVGPKDLPQLMRTVGQAVGKVKRMAREFQRSLEDAASDADLSDLKELRDLKKGMSGLDFRHQAAKAARSHLSNSTSSAKDGQDDPATKPDAAEADTPTDSTTEPGVTTAPVSEQAEEPDAQDKPRAVDSDAGTEDATPRRASAGA